MAMNHVPESPTNEEENVWRWWEEEERGDGKKWVFLEHKGPVFPDPYVWLPSNVKFYYNGEHMQLSDLSEEAAGFYAKMLDHGLTTQRVFNENFFKDWRKNMTSEEKEKIVDLAKCGFKEMRDYFIQQTKDKERKNRTKEEKKVLKEKKEAIIAEYGWCNIDGHRQRIGNFKIEPPGLFRGLGEHPKQGKIKRRILPEDVTINCSQDSKIPEAPPGHNWQKVIHDPTVTWLVRWYDTIFNAPKYAKLGGSSKFRGEADRQKYENARSLHNHIEQIREDYKADWSNKETLIRQRGVALYFIDELALRAGNKKDGGQVDTFGCCSLQVKHVTLHKKDENNYLVKLNFIGKACIPYHKEFPVPEKVFENLQSFIKDKEPTSDLFDGLNTQILNSHLKKYGGITVKVFRTYIASRTFQEELKNTDPKEPLTSYMRALREVAKKCNHKRTTNEMDNLVTEVSNLNISSSNEDEENDKNIATESSKMNYIDPRITVAWCNKYKVDPERVFTKSQYQKILWAIRTVTGDFDFLNISSNDSMSGDNNEEEVEQDEEDEDENIEDEYENEEEEEEEE